MLHLGDITKISGLTAPIVDVVIGGSPCQDLSIAGKRAGLDGERSGLFMEQLRIIKEMRDKDERIGKTGVDVRPRYMVWENVPGAFSSNKGEDFRIILEETAKIKDKNAIIPRPKDGKWTTSGCIVGDGWSIAWRVLDAQFWGVPQRRRRISLVADFGGESAHEILFISQSVSGNTESCESKRKETPINTTASIGTADSIGFDGYNGESTGDKEATLSVNCGMSTGRNGVLARIDKSATLSTLQDQTLFQPVIATDRALFNQGINAKYDMGIDYSGVAHTVVAKGPGGVCYGINGDVSGTIVRCRYIVRRLTPLECERLQGYPDGWTDIGERIDTNGKKHQTTDSARYKALGNSIALPPWKWVLKRISACYERDATMASLFDGIGGFPYLWEQLNGKGSCLWASEIEEFPIAVTKRRINNV